MVELLQRLRNSWEWLSVVTALVCAAAIAWFALTALPDEDDCGFCPISLNRIAVEPDPVVIGEPALLFDGMCNRSDDPISASVTLFLEAPGPALAPAAAPVQLVDRDVVIDPNTCYPREDPIEIEAVPPTVPLGTWRAAIRIMARSESGEFQILTRTSEYFDVVAADGH